MASSSSSSSQPNVIFMFADDWGINEWSTSPCSRGATPFIDELVRTESLLLHHNYVCKVCSPSRASFLSGRYPSSLGLQNYVFNMNIPVSLTRQASLISSEFQNAGYATHMIGKWHLGYQSWEYTPTYRGFDTFRGFYNGFTYYYDHTSGYYDDSTETAYEYYDMRNGLSEDIRAKDSSYYGVWMERDDTLSLLSKYADVDDDDSDPFFLYLCWQASHAPDEAPMDYTDLFDESIYDTDTDSDLATNRVSSLAQSATLDDAISEIVSYLKSNGLWDNTLLVFSSDNGGAYARGDNYPLRGFKNTSFEGGIRVPAFVSGGYLSPERYGQRLDNVMIHVSDWYPTLLEAANIPLSSDSYTMPLDGKSVWKYIANTISDENIETDVFIGTRELLLDLNDVYCAFTSCGAIRVGDYKFLRGDNIGSLKPDHEDGDLWYRDMAFSICDDLEFELNFGCQNKVSSLNGDGCTMDEQGCLFNIANDPCEYVNLANDPMYAQMQGIMSDKLDAYQSKATTAVITDDVIMDIYEFDPNVICNSDYWCPFQELKDVQFEQTLKKDYDALYGKQRQQQQQIKIKTKKSKLTPHPPPLILIIPVVIAVLLSLICVFKHRTKNAKTKTTKNEKANVGYEFNEISPLIN